MRFRLVQERLPGGVIPQDGRIPVPTFMASLKMLPSFVVDTYAFALF
jgi:hypothetical protein